MSPLTVFEMLSNDERVIVLSVEEDRQVYTWNRSVTLQCWNVDDNGGFTEVDIRTCGVEIPNVEAARKRAQEWHLDARTDREVEVAEKRAGWSSSM